MARKNGLNRKDQILCAKWLTEGVAAQDIAKKLKTSVAIVKLFTQEALDTATAKAKARLIAQGKASKKHKETAEVLKKVLAKTEDDGNFE